VPISPMLPTFMPYVYLVKVKECVHVSLLGCNTMWTYVDRYQHLWRNILPLSSTLQLWRWRQYVLPKHWYEYNYETIWYYDNQKTNTDIFTATRTLQLTKKSISDVWACMVFNDNVSVSQKCKMCKVWARNHTWDW
jgi:hypothetical protein